jgi:hypothetical protein
MKKTNIYLVIVGVAILGASFFLFGPSKEHALDQNIQSDTQKEFNATITIDGIIENEILSGINNTTLLDSMLELGKTHSSIGMQTREFEGLGILIEEMGGMKNGNDNMYWQYYVNSEQPMVGANDYIVEDGDNIEWKFEESAF